MPPGAEEMALDGCKLLMCVFVCECVKQGEPLYFLYLEVQTKAESKEPFKTCKRYCACLFVHVCLPVAVW